MSDFRLCWDMFQSSMNSEMSDYKRAERSNVELEINYETPISEGVKVRASDSRWIAAH